MKFLMLIFMVLLSASAVAADPHCISEEANGNIVTQCDDGTVTIVRYDSVETICHPAPSGEPICKTIKERQ